MAGCLWTWNFTQAQQTGKPSADSAPPAAPAQNTSAAAPSDKDEGGKQDEASDREKDGSKTHVRLGTITVGAGYVRYPSTPFFYPYGFYPYGFYPATPFFGSAFFYDPFYGPFGYAPYYPYAPNYFYAQGKGEIKIRMNAKAKETAVYIDGAYAGNAEKLKSIWLAPGPYNLSLKARDGRTFEQRIYVLSGKTLKVDASLQAPRPSTNQEKN